MCVRPGARAPVPGAGRSARAAVVVRAQWLSPPRVRAPEARAAAASEAGSRRLSPAGSRSGRLWPVASWNATSRWSSCRLRACHLIVRGCFDPVDRVVRHAATRRAIERHPPRVGSRRPTDGRDLINDSRRNVVAVVRDQPLSRLRSQPRPPRLDHHAAVCLAPGGHVEGGAVPEAVSASAAVPLTAGSLAPDDPPTLGRRRWRWGEPTSLLRLRSGVAGGRQRTGRRPQARR